MARSVSTALMFQGVAEQAMNRYVALFGGAVTYLEKYGTGEGIEGTVKQARFTLGSQQFMCIDSPVQHAFTFTPSMSIFIECESEAELDRAFADLSSGGQVMMPPGNYGFSTKFAWISDSYGVSWQLNLP